MAMTNGIARLVSSGTPAGWPGAIELYVYYKVVSQSIVDNTTTLSLGMYVVTPNKWDIGGWTDYNGSYIGTATSGANCKTFNGDIPNFYGTRWLVENQEVTVNHNADGTKTATIYWHWGVNSGWSGIMRNPSGSFNVELTTIPRAATIMAVGDFTDEENPTITYSNPAGASVTSLKATISLEGSSTALVTRSDLNPTGSSYTFTLSPSEKTAIQNAIINSQYAYVNFTLTTTIGSALEPSVKKAKVTIVNANPTVSPTIVDSNDVTTTLTGDSNKFIRHYSNAKITFDAIAKKGATIKSRKVTNGGQSLAADGTINGVTSGQFTFIVEDSRGNSIEENVSKTLIEYVKLSCIIDNTQPSTDGSFTFKVSGSYFNGSFGAIANTLNVYYRYKVSGGSYPEYAPMIVTKSGNTYTATVNLTGLDYQKNYIFQAYAVDKLETATTGEKPTKALPVFDWSATDFNVNEIVQMRRGSVVHNARGISGSTGWIKIWNSGVLGNHPSSPFIFSVIQRGVQPYRLILRFSNTDPGTSATVAEFLKLDSPSTSARIVKASDNSFDLYIQKSEAYDNVCIAEFYHDQVYNGRMGFGWLNEHVTTPPDGTTAIYTPYASADHSHSPLEAWPINSIYISYSQTSPAELFGGTWARISNAFLYGVDSGTHIGRFGGEDSHTLTLNELPSHTHDTFQRDPNASVNADKQYLVDTYGTGSVSPGWTLSLSATSDKKRMLTGATGGGAPHNNMPPYITVAIWRRTA